MKWVALVVVVSLAAYTVLTLAFRKPPGHAHDPYAEAQARAATAENLKAAGYAFLSAISERPAEPETVAKALGLFRAPDSAAPAGLPAELAGKLIVQPKLPDSFEQLVAPATAKPGEPYQILFTCRLPDDKELHADTSVFIKGDDIVVASHFEKLSGDEFRARTRAVPLLLTIPAGTFAAGRTFTITLAGRAESRRWTVLVH